MSLGVVFGRVGADDSSVQVAALMVLTRFASERACTASNLDVPGQNGGDQSWALPPARRLIIRATRMITP